MGLPIRPPAAPQTKNRVGGAADVGVLDESQRRFVAQFGADVWPLLKDCHDCDQRNNDHGADRGGAIVGNELRHVRESDRGGGGDRVDDQLPHLVGDVKRRERDSVARDGARQQTFRDNSTLDVAVHDQHDGCRCAGRRTEEHAVDGFAFVSGQANVKRSQSQHDRDRKRRRRADEAKDDSAGDSSQHRRHPRIELAVEGLEESDPQESDEGADDQNERENGIGHGCCRTPISLKRTGCRAKNRRDRSMSMWI